MNKSEVYEYLDAHGVKYEVVEHPPAMTVDDILSFDLPELASFAKNLFLRDDKKRNYYLLTVRHDLAVSIKSFQEKAGTRKLSFASEDDLMRLLGLRRGAVTPFGLLNDTQCEVKLYLDSYYEGGRICIHPNENTASVYIATDDLVRLLRDHGSEVEFVEM